MRKRVSLLQKCQDWRWSPPSLPFNGFRGSFPGVKRPERFVNHLLPSSAKVKNGWSNAFFPPNMPSCRGQGQLYAVVMYIAMISILISDKSPLFQSQSNHASIPNCNNFVNCYKVSFIKG